MSDWPTWPGSSVDCVAVEGEGAHVSPTPIFGVAGTGIQLLLARNASFDARTIRRSHSDLRLTIELSVAWLLLAFVRAGYVSSG